MNMWDKIFLSVMMGVAVFALGAVLYGTGARDKDRQVCEAIGGVYVSSHCLTQEAVINYEGDE